MQALYEASQSTDRPSVILAKTFKGKGFPGIEDKENWHGKPLGTNTNDIISAIEVAIKNNGASQFLPMKPPKDAPLVDITNIKLSSPPNYKKGNFLYLSLTRRVIFSFDFLYLLGARR